MIAGKRESALDLIGLGRLGSPPPELPNHVLIVCPFGHRVNVTSVMPAWQFSTVRLCAEVTLLRVLWGGRGKQEREPVKNVFLVSSRQFAFCLAVLHLLNGLSEAMQVRR